MGQREETGNRDAPHHLAARSRRDIGASLAAVDAELARRYPGDPGTRQPVHTVYVPADVFAAGHRALLGRPGAGGARRARPRRRRPSPPCSACPTSSPQPVHDRVRAKLEREPVEDLRIDFEDGYGAAPRRRGGRRRGARRRAWSRRRTRTAARRPVHGHPDEVHGGRRPRPRHPHPRHLPDRADGRAAGCRRGWCSPCPRSPTPSRSRAMVRLLRGSSRRRTGWPRGGIGFEIQIETTQAILGRGRHRHRRPDDRRRRGPRHRPALRHLRLQRRLRGQRRPPVERPPGRRPRQGGHAGRRRRHRRAAVATARPTSCRSARPRQVHDAWRLHYGLVRRSLARAYYQGWDMHPGHLPTRYAAVYAFYREGFEPAAARLAGLRRPDRRRRDGRAGHRQGAQRLPAARPGLRRAGRRRRSPGATGLDRAELDDAGRAAAGRCPEGQVRPGGSRPSRARSSRAGSSIRRGGVVDAPSAGGRAVPRRCGRAGPASWATTVTPGRSRSASSKSSKPTRATGRGAVGQHPDRGDRHPVVAGEERGDRRRAGEHRSIAAAHPLRGGGAQRHPGVVAPAVPASAIASR